VLIYQIDNRSYKKSLLGQTNFDQSLTPELRAQAMLAVKDAYTFDFVSGPRNGRSHPRALSRICLDPPAHVDGYRLLADRANGNDVLSIALEGILDRIMADNPIATYPEIALCEALLNALGHTDYRIPGPILIKQFKEHIEISNPGELPVGITPENIPRHEPVPRNPGAMNIPNSRA
jgi:ATP-dependent DNA helicase RecG